MRRRMLKSWTALGLSAVMTITSVGPFQSGARAEAAEKAASADAAVLQQGAEIVQDTTLNSKVLSLPGGAFDAGWLKLPDNLYSGVTDGFTIALKVKPDTAAGNYERIFQSTSIEYGDGDTGWWDAPDMAFNVGATDGGWNSMHYLGTVKNTTDNATSGGKTRMKMTWNKTMTKGEWHDIVVSVSKEAYSVYLDGTKLELTSTQGDGDLAQVLTNTFEGGFLESYVNNAIGHSVYSSDNDFKGMVDDVTFYKRALSEAEAKALPADAAYRYTFEADTVSGTVVSNTIKEEAVQADYVWNFDNADGTTVANVGTAGTGNATLQGSAKVEAADLVIGDKTYSKEGNKVLTLAGGSKGTSYVDLPADIYQGVTAQTGFTYSFWAKTAGNVASYSRAISSATAANGDEFAFAPYAADKVWNVIFDGTNHSSAIFETEPTKDVWNYITFTVSTEGIQLYVNGEKVGTTPKTGDEATFEARLDSMKNLVVNALGKTCSGWPDPDCAIQLDDVSLYKKALTAKEVAAVANTYGFEVTVKDEEQNAGVDAENVYTDGTQLTQVEALTTASPDGTVVGKIWKSEDGRFFYSVSKNGESVIHASNLGLITTGADLSAGLSLVEGSKKTQSINETYELIAGAKSTGTDSCNETAFDLTDGKGNAFTVILRAYDDGVAYRYAMNGEAGKKVSIQEETGDIVLPDNTLTWSFTPGVNYEETFIKRKMSVIQSSNTKISTPFLASVEDDKYWVLITEGSVFNEDNPYCASYFNTEAGKKNLKWIFGNKQTKNVEMTYPFHTPWRITVVTDNLNDLVTTDIVTDVNPVSKIEDTSWIKPGKMAWSWWSSAGDFPIEYGTQKDYIDFAAENGWDYVMLDYGWVLWDDYKTKVEELCDYAAKKGIGIFLWYGVNNTGHAAAGAYPKYSLLDEATIKREIEWASEVGVKGVKVDYYESDNQETMQQMYWCADYAAQNEIMVIFHGCTLPNGEHRTYPNILAYEAVFGEEYHKWFENPNAANCLTYLFTRNVTGGMDFTPTAMKVNLNGATTGFQLAETVVFESPSPMFAQSIYNYQGYGALPFLNDVSTTWEETKFLEGYPGEYNAVARRTGDDWYIGAMTLKARTTNMKLDFLGEGNYTAYIYKTNSDNTDVVLETQTVTKDTVLALKLAAKDGAAVKITKGGMTTSTIYDPYDYYEAENAVLAGTAKSHVENNQYASGMKDVGYVGGGDANTITFDNVTAEKDGTYKLKIFFISGEKRDVYVSVNGGTGVKVSDLIANTGDWMVVSAREITVDLKAGTNTIKLYNDTANAPSIDRIGIAYDGINLDKKDMQLATGKSGQLTATVADDLANEKITWSSTDETVAVVDETGKVTAVGSGNAVIQAQVGDSVAVCAVTVVTMPTGITLSKDTVNLTVDYNGDSYYYDEAQTKDTVTATVEPANVSNKKVIWSSDNENILVDKGVISVKEGLKEDITGAKVTVTSAADGSIQAVCTVNVKMNYVADVVRPTAITVTPAQATVVPGQTLQLSAAVTPADAKDPKVLWSVKESDKSKASVTEDGLVTVTAITATTVTVIATARDDKRVTKEVVITVNPDRQTVAEYSFDGTIGSGKTVGSKTTAAPKSKTPTYVEGVNGGKAIAITGAGSDGVVLDTVPKDNTYTISYWMKANTTSTFSPAIFIGAADQTTEAWVSIGQGWQSSWDTAPMVWSKANGSYYDVVPTTGIQTGKWYHVTLSVDNGTGTIYIDGKQTATGTVAAVIGKDTKIFLGVNAWDTPFNGAIDELKIYDRALSPAEIQAIAGEITPGSGIDNPQTVKVTGVKLNKTAASLVAGKTLQLTATVTPVNATNKAVTWKSSNPAVASVSSTGKVTAKKAGTAKITVTTKDGNKTATATIKVYAKTTKVTVKAAGYEVKKITLVKKKSVKLVSAVAPKTAMQGVTYKSSKKKVATVSSKGVVKAKKAGTTKITIKSKDGLKKQTIKVTVVNKAVKNKTLKLKKSKVTLKKKGATAQISVKKLTKKATSKITYKVKSGKKYVKVDKYGKVTCKIKPTKKAKKAVITVKCGKATKNYMVTIKR